MGGGLVQFWKGLTQFFWSPFFFGGGGLDLCSSEEEENQDLDLGLLGTVYLDISSTNLDTRSRSRSRLES